MRGKPRLTALVPALLLVLLTLSLPSAGPAAAAEGKPAVTLSTAQAGTGGSITVNGTGWRPRTLLMLLICGQATPARGVVGGTNSCANADGRAVTTDADGRFSRSLPVTEPPVPCPCVVHVATATGAKAQADAVFQVAGHPVEPLPAQTAGGRLSVLSDTRLDGSGSLLTWFGAPPSRTLSFTVGNVGTAAVENPVFQVGTEHGVFAPQWDERQWHGTLGPGEKARVELPVELTAGAHGDYTVSSSTAGRSSPNSRGGGPPLGRDPVLDPALPGGAGGGLPHRDGGGGPGTPAPRRPTPLAAPGHGRRRRRRTAIALPGTEPPPPRTRPCRGSPRTPVRARRAGSPHRTKTIRRVPRLPAGRDPRE